jgi:hypothetical protein
MANGEGQKAKGIRERRKANGKRQKKLRKGYRVQGVRCMGKAINEWLTANG